MHEHTLSINLHRKGAITAFEVIMGRECSTYGATALMLQPVCQYAPHKAFGSKMVRHNLLPLLPRILTHEDHVEVPTHGVLSQGNTPYIYIYTWRPGRYRKPFKTYAPTICLKLKRVGGHSSIFIDVPCLSVSKLPWYTSTKVQCAWYYDPINPIHRLQHNLALRGCRGLSSRPTAQIPPCAIDI